GQFDRAACARGSSRTPSHMTALLTWPKVLRERLDRLPCKRHAGIPRGDARVGLRRRADVGAAFPDPRRRALAEVAERPRPLDVRGSEDVHRLHVGGGEPQIEARETGYPPPPAEVNGPAEGSGGRPPGD